METAMLVEAGPKRRKLLSELLEEEGLNVESVKTAEEALAERRKAPPVSFCSISICQRCRDSKSSSNFEAWMYASSCLQRTNRPRFSKVFSFGDVIAGAVETTAFQARFRGILERHSRENQRRVRVASSGHPVRSHVLAALHDPETGGSMPAGSHRFSERRSRILQSSPR